MGLFDSVTAGLFDSVKKPTFLKEDSEAETQLAALNELRKEASGELAEELDAEIRRVDAGLFGEKSVRFELENSHIPMLILHDLFLEFDGLTAQIDYMVFTRHFQYVIECKNLYGNIEINNRGDFIRTFGSGKHAVKEGIYSPITQNRRHMELIKAICLSGKSNIVSKALFERNFDSLFRSVVVIANPKTVLFDKYAPKATRSQVIRCDQLADFIRKTDQSDSTPVSEKVMCGNADFFLGLNAPPKTDYVQKYRQRLAEQKELSPQTADTAEQDAKQEKEQEKEPCCPRCGAPMVQRQAARGANAGKTFWGCSRFPNCRGIIAID